MTILQDTIRQLHDTLPRGTTLVAVSKYKPVADILEAYEAGQRAFGENHAVEMAEKYDALPKDIEWHFIGHLQTNKVRLVVPVATLIHSVDSPRLLAAIHREALRHGIRQKVLLQLHVAQETTKYGFTPDELWTMLEERQWRKMNGVEICGLMAMATHTDDVHQIAQDFHAARHEFERIRDTFFRDTPSFSICSWGMSEDYKVALLHGSNMVRLGTLIFGPRDKA